MKKPARVVSGVLVALLVAVAVVAGLFVATFDADRYRSQIVTQVEKTTGRSLALEAVSLRLFPTLGIKLRGVTLGNAAGFANGPFAEIGHANASVRVWPLVMRRRIELGAMDLDSVRLHLERDKAGKTNWQDLLVSGGHAGTPPESTGDEEDAERGGEALRLAAVGTIRIRDGRLDYRDDASGREYGLDDLNLRLGALIPGRRSDLELSVVATSARPQSRAKMELKGQLTADLDTRRYRINGLAIKVDASGAAVPGGPQELRLHGNLDYEQERDQLTLGDGKLDAAGISLSTKLRVSGLTTGALHYQGAVATAPFDPRVAMRALGLDTYQPQDASVLRSAALSGELDGDSTSIRLKGLSARLDDTTIRGELVMRPLAPAAFTLTLDLDQFDVDRYQPAAPTPAAGEQGGAPAGGAAPDARIPSAVLAGPSVDGRVTAGQLKLRGVEMQNVQARLHAPAEGTRELRITGDLYGGKLDGSTTLTPARQPRLTQQLALDGVDLGPLLKAAADNDLLLGRGSLKADLFGSGSTKQGLTRTLSGKLSLRAVDGAIRGINLAQLLRQASALVRSGGNVAEAKAAPEQQTDFSELSISATIRDGIARSDDLQLKGPLLRASGAGTADLAAATLDYTVKPTLSAAITGQGDKETNQPKGITIPVHISGPFSELRYRPDLTALIRENAKAAIRDRLGQQEDELKQERNKLRDKLKDKLPLKKLF